MLDLQLALPVVKLCMPRIRIQATVRPALAPNFLPSARNLALLALLSSAAHGLGRLTTQSIVPSNCAAHSSPRFASS